MADDWGLMENWDEPDEGAPDTWWCDVCQTDVTMWIEQFIALPTHCPACGTKFDPPDVGLAKPPAT